MRSRKVLYSLQPNFDSPLFFIPNRGNFSKGIYVTLYTEFAGSEEEAIQLYKDFYKEAQFTVVSDQEIHLKQVVNTNKCILHISKKKGMLLITSVIDNLIKGASGQAIHNMNLMFGIEEKNRFRIKSKCILDMNKITIIGGGKLREIHYFRIGQ